MKKNICLIVLLFSLILLPNLRSEAALQPKLSTEKIILEKSENTILKVKSSSKKVRWLSDSPNISLTSRKQGVRIKALYAGKAVITAKVGKKVLTCKVNVSKVPFQNRSPKACIYSAVTKDLSWEEVPGAEGYIVYAKNKNGKYKVLKKVKGGSKLYINDDSNKKNASDFYRIKAYRKVNGKMVYSKAVTQKYILE